MKFTLISLFLLFVITSTSAQSLQTTAIHTAKTGMTAITGKQIVLQQADVK